MEYRISIVGKMEKSSFYHKFGRNVVYGKTVDDLIYTAVITAMERIRQYNFFDKDKGNICQYIENAVYIYQIIYQQARK